MALAPGDRFGSYVVVGPLGTGGMGEVYRAHDSRLRRDVALKVLPDAVRLEPGRLARFEQEARALAALNHPGIAAIYGVEEGRIRDDGGQPILALVLELVEGGTLSTRIARGAIPGPEALAIARQIAEALEAAHSKGIVHRDLKPGNIAITPEGTVKVLDFGLAKIVEPDPTVSDETKTVGATREGTVVGTAAYMSPEQATGQAVDKRSDIWAFGCVLYEMLTGRRVFAGDDVAAILGAVLKSEPDWRKLPAGTPSSIRRLLRRALNKDSRQRLGDIRDARIEIDEPGAESERIPSAPAFGTWPARIVALTLAGVIVALAIPAVRYWRETPQAEIRSEISTPSTLDPLHFALSPDGRHIVFVASGDGPDRLWLRPLDTTDARPMAGTDGAYLPFWSADSQSVGFFARGKLHRIDINGGPPQPVADASAGRGGTWNAEGTILFAPNNQGRLMRVPATGGAPTVVLPSDRRRGNGDRLPQFLPDDRHFLFYSTGGAETSGVYLGSLDGGEPKRLTGADSGAAYLAPDKIVFVRGGALLAQRLDLGRGELTGAQITLADSVGYDSSLNLGGFSISANGHIAYRPGGASRVQLTWFDRGGKPVGTAGQPDIHGLQFPDLSPDERLVAVYREVQNSNDIWRLDLISGVLSRFTFDPANDINPAFSKSGNTRIAFSSNRKGVADIYVKPLNGPGAEELAVTSPYVKVAQDWSLDDRYLLYYQGVTGDRDLWAQDMQNTGGSPIAVANTRFQESMAQFSPNGRWVAYQTDESGRFEIFVQSFPAADGKHQVSIDGGIAPRWSKDGKELYFVAPDRRMMAAAVAEKGLRLEIKKPEVLFRTRIVGGGSTGINKPNYAVSRDGRFLINQLVEEPTIPITLILNWKP